MDRPRTWASCTEAVLHRNLRRTETFAGGATHVSKTLIVDVNATPIVKACQRADGRLDYSAWVQVFAVSSRTLWGSVAFRRWVGSFETWSPCRELAVADRSYGSVLAQLAFAQKGPAKGAPAYSRFVNRRLGRYLAAAAFLLGFGPNQVTAISAAFTTAAIALVCIARPTVEVGLLVTGLFLLGYAFDSADGQVARLRRSSSLSGEFLDHMVDCTKIASMHLAVLVSMYRFGWYHDRWWLLVPIGMSVSTSVLFFGMTLKDQMVRGHSVAIGSSVPQLTTSKARALMLLPTDFGVVCLGYTLLGWHAGFIAFYTFLLAAHLGFLALASAGWYRSVQALDSK